MGLKCLTMKFLSYDTSEEANYSIFDYSKKNLRCRIKKNQRKKFADLFKPITKFLPVNFRKSGKESINFGYPFKNP
jgi:hypothetical protein